MLCTYADHTGMVEAFIITWNESETIHLTIAHYKKFCSRITIFDNFSDDNTREIALSMGCDVRLFGVKGVLSDLEYLTVKNNCWKKSEADWVIVCDADEIFIPPPVWNTDVTVYKTHGWNIFSNQVPRETWLEIQTGMPDENYSKLVCFKPKHIQEINYVYGCHQAKPVGKVIYSNGSFPLFHYKHIGGADRVIRRHALYAARLSTHNKKWKLGFQYQEPADQTRKYFEECLKKSTVYSPPGGF